MKAIFNGDVHEDGEDETAIDSYVGSIQVNLPEGTVPNVGLSFGGSYIPNIADSDALAGELAVADTVQDNVAAFGAFVNVSFMEILFFKADL
jgi:hypothetical protein